MLVFESLPQNPARERKKEVFKIQQEKEEVFKIQQEKEEVFKIQQERGGAD